MLVLSLLALVTILVLALFQLARNDVASAVAYERGTSTRLLAETALNLVIGQIQDATQRPGEAWASQPGLIRTFDTSGNAARAYKLYSAPLMRLDGVFDPAAGDDLPSSAAAWNADPNLWVDLNEPIQTTRTDASGSAIHSFVYPIVNPKAKDEVEGFDYDAAWSSDTDATESVAMPVRWIYLLQDGTLVPGDAGSGEMITIAGMSPANPAIARLAFWTDDETSKVNINTAGGGTPWDTPMANTYPSGASINVDSLASRPTSWGNLLYEADFAHFQPSQNEFQRYPGHPATTSLAPVLFAPVSRFLGIDPASASFEQRRDIMEEIYKVAPRVTGGNTSSRGGWRRGSAVLALESDRFYTSVDELLFAKNISSGAREANPIEQVEADRQETIETIKFFLTAHSRGPETTLSNKPRVVAWPVHENTASTHRSAFDRLIAFNGTVGGNRYYFTRENPLSTSADWNTRNQAIYTYLQGLTGNAIPGFGGNFASKMGVDRDQVLTQIFDYIRCLNLQDVTVTTPYADYPALPIAERDSLRGMVSPMIIESGVGAGTRGFGRMPTISELTFIIITRDKDFPGKTEPINLQMMLVPELFSPMGGWSAMATNMKIKFTEIDIRINGQTRRNGALTSSSGGSVSVNFMPNGASVSDSNPVEMFAAHIPRSSAASDGPGSQHGHSRLGGYLAPGLMLYKPYKSGSGLENLKKHIPISEEFSHPNIISALDGARETSTDRLILEKGSKIAFTVEAPYSGGTPMVIQSFEYTFEQDVMLLAPMVGNTSEPPQEMTVRVSAAIGSNPGGLVRYNFPIHADSVFSLVPHGGSIELEGDTRIIAASGNIGAYFGIMEETETRQASHSLKSNYTASPNQARFGNLVKGISQYASTIQKPDVPFGVDGVTNHLGAPGDWDNGVGLLADGPYINKADEGTSQPMGDNIPYIGHIEKENITKTVEATLFSPNRQFPSPVMFGSLPTGVKRGQRWQSLLFRPALDTLPGGTSHPGTATGSNPADHLILDNFWMPVVEPYAISEPFSTAGKINLNYAIAPFHYIRRDTGIRALLHDARIIAMNPTDSTTNGGTFVEKYKTSVPLSGSSADFGAAGISVRKEIDIDATIEFFEERFAQGRPFLSATEICEIPLVPKGIVSPGADVSTIKTALNTFWAAHKLTGDNSLERPYAHIYPRVTTKSNTYTVHVRAQRLQVSQDGLADGQFGPGKGAVTGEFRGSFTIERFLDPNSDGLVRDSGSGSLVPAGENDADAFLGPYKFRILNSKQLSL